MKQYVTFLSIIFLAVLLFPAATASGRTDPHKWRQIRKEALNDTTISQLLLVKYRKGSSAKAVYYVRNNDLWKFRRRGDANVGRLGIGKAREGDARTPEGELRVTVAFGILPNPGTVLKYIDIDNHTIACDSNCEWYNQIVDTRVSGEVKGERMWEIVPAYNYGFATDYNKENIYPRGSAIFLHCKGAKGYTGGCVALDEDFIKLLLTEYSTGLLLSIH